MPAILAARLSLGSAARPDVCCAVPSVARWGRPRHRARLLVAAVAASRTEDAPRTEPEAAGHNAGHNFGHNVPGLAPRTRVDRPRGAPRPGDGTPGAKKTLDDGGGVARPRRARRPPAVAAGVATAPSSPPVGAGPVIASLASSRKRRAAMETLCASIASAVSAAALELTPPTPPGGDAPPSHAAITAAVAAALTAAAAGGDVALDPPLFTFLAARFSRPADWPAPLAILDSMAALGLPLHVPAANAALAACGYTKRWRDGLGVMKRLRSTPPGPDAESFYSLMRALNAGGQWLYALQTWEELKASGLPPGPGACDAALFAAGRLGRWRTTVESLSRLEAGGWLGRVSPQTLGVALETLRCGHQLPALLHAFDRLLTARCPPDARGMTSLLAACGADALAATTHWRRGLACYRSYRVAAPGPSAVDAGVFTALWAMLRRANCADATAEATPLLADFLAARAGWGVGATTEAVAETGAEAGAEAGAVSDAAVIDSTSRDSSITGGLFASLATWGRWSESLVAAKQLIAAGVPLHGLTWRAAATAAADGGDGQGLESLVQSLMSQHAAGGVPGLGAAAVAAIAAALFRLGMYESLAAWGKWASTVAGIAPDRATACLLVDGLACRGQLRAAIAGLESAQASGLVTAYRPEALQQVTLVGLSHTGAQVALLGWLRALRCSAEEPGAPRRVLSLHLRVFAGEGRLRTAAAAQLEACNRAGPAALAALLSPVGMLDVRGLLLLHTGATYDWLQSPRGAALDESAGLRAVAVPDTPGVGGDSPQGATGGGRGRPMGGEVDDTAA